MDGSLVESIREAAADGIAFDGLRVERNGEVCSVEVPAEGVTQVSTEAVEDLVTDYPAYAANWRFWHAEAPQKEDRWAFLRWLEDAEETGVRSRYDALASGITTTWGQLSITASLETGDDATDEVEDEAEDGAEDGAEDDTNEDADNGANDDAAVGDRTYEIVHAEDADDPSVDADDLETYTDPREAREIGRLDVRERYRPLKTAPSLRRGWRLADLDAADLVRAVEWFYPATIANWYREREDDLDITNWTETAARQTGIYEVIAELPDEAVDWMAQACCVDSQCLKRRRWDLTAEEPLDAPRGDGAFPCREPCSLVITAARKWTTLEGEDPRTFEIEMTLSEANQLSEIVDAVADGRIDEIREADVNDGANRYRARYLRAKLFDDEGLPLEEP